MGADSPRILYGQQEDYRRLYFSEPDAALKLPVTIMQGYGQVPMGTVLFKNASAAGSMNKYGPYSPAAETGAETEPTGRAYLVQNTDNNAYLYVTIEDSYKFIVGDDLYINDDTTTAENLGAITAIDRTTYTHMAKITVTTAVGVTSFTTARFAYVACEGYATAAGILEKSVDTGKGADAAGALATMIIGNCILYSGRLTNCDATAISALSMTAYGNLIKMA